MALNEVPGIVGGIESKYGCPPILEWDIVKLLVGTHVDFSH